MKQPTTLTANVTHGQLPVWVGASSASPVRAHAPIAPPAKIAASSRRSAGSAPLILDLRSAHSAPRSDLRVG